MTLDIRQPRPIFRNRSNAPQEWSAHVLSMNVTKTQSIEPGTFEVRLLPYPIHEDSPTQLIGTYGMTAAAYSAFRAQDVVHLGMRWFNPATGKLENNIFMWGLVDNVYYDYHQQGNSVSRVVVVRGRDATKLLITDTIVFAAMLANNSKVKQALGKTAEFISYMRGATANSKENVFFNMLLIKTFAWLVNNIPAISVTLEEEGQSVQRQVKDILGYEFTTYKDDRLYMPGASMYSGSMINYFRSILDEQFYEMWIDTVPTNLSGDGDAYPKLIIRPRPFDFDWEVDSDGTSFDNSALWVEKSASLTDSNGLPIPSSTTAPTVGKATSPVTGSSLTIPNEDILHSGLGVGDYETFTFYTLTADNAAIGSSVLSQIGGYLALIDIPASKIYGIRALSGETKCVYIDNIQPYRQYALSLMNADPTTWPAKAMGVTLAQESGIGTGTRNLLKRRDRLWRWNRYNHLFESGTMKIKGQPVSVGGNVFLPEKFSRGVFDDSQNRKPQLGMTYYVTGWGQMYQWGADWETTLELIRGHNEKDLKAYANSRKFDKAASVDTNGIATMTVQEILGQLSGGGQ